MRTQGAVAGGGLPHRVVEQEEGSFFFSRELLQLAAECSPGFFLSVVQSTRGGHCGGEPFPPQNGYSGGAAFVGEVVVGDDSGC